MSGYNYMNTKIDIEYDPVIRVYRIWMYENKDGMTYNFHMDNGDLVRTELPNDGVVKDVKPLMQFDFYLAEMLFGAIGEYLERKGRQTVNENLTQGKLIATEKHLEDMKTIAFKLLKIQ